MAVAAVAAAEGGFMVERAEAAAMVWVVGVPIRRLSNLPGAPHYHRLKHTGNTTRAGELTRREASAALV